jgi:hypothetical protein
VIKPSTTTKTSTQHNKQKPPFPWVRKGGGKQQNTANRSSINNKIINNISNTRKQNNNSACFDCANRTVRNEQILLLFIAKGLGNCQSKLP